VEARDGKCKCTVRYEARGNPGRGGGAYLSVRPALNKVCPEHMSPPTQCMETYQDNASASQLCPASGIPLPPLGIAMHIPILCRHSAKGALLCTPPPLPLLPHPTLGVYTGGMITLHRRTTHQPIPLKMTSLPAPSTMMVGPPFCALVVRMARGSGATAPAEGEGSSGVACTTGAAATTGVATAAIAGVVVAVAGVVVETTAAAVVAAGVATDVAVVAAGVATWASMPAVRGVGVGMRARGWKKVKDCTEVLAQPGSL